MQLKSIMNKNRVFWLVILLILSVISQGLAWTSGSADIDIRKIFSHTLDSQLIWDLRLPRSLNAFAIGGLLALAGNLMQILLRNPLADPYILGISSGAAVGALFAMLLGLNRIGVMSGSFIAALLTLWLVFTLARKNRHWSAERLLLIGIMIAAGWGALISLLLAMTPASHLPGVIFWLLGDLSYTNSPILPLLILISGLALTYPLATQLNMAARGEMIAQSLGVAINRLQIFIYIISGLLTAVAVTHAGTIGFIGLVIPHILRLLIGNDQRILLPCSALLGGSLLTFADTLSRTLIAPQQLPVGAITAIIGVPIFLYLLVRQKI